MLIKLGEAIAINPEDLHPLEKLAEDSDLNIEYKMAKFAQELKVIAPQAKDFLYFTCIMMHAAEAACYNDDGSPKKTAKGEIVTAKWDKVGEGVKWICNDPNIKPYKNNNSDIFPELELKTAYKNWVGRPLCLDHQSQSVDKIRGVIVDTVYDDRRKRVIALCALDAKNYSDLADKVKTGVATNVSMGTAVGRAVCSDCQRVARTEKDFCQHMLNKSCYGEINLDLSPIELSLVVSGADPKAKVKHIIASDVAKAAELLTDYLQMKESSTKVSTQDLESVKKDLETLTSKMSLLVNGSIEQSETVGPSRSHKWGDPLIGDVAKTPVLEAPEAFPTYASELQRAILGAQTKLASLQENLQRISEEPTMTKKNAYFQGTEEPTPGQKKYPVDPLNDKARLQDKSLHGPAPFPDSGDTEGLYPGDAELKKRLLRLADENERALFREAALKKAKEQLLSKGYFLGTEEPKPGKQQYSADPLNEKARMQDKHMVGKKPFPGVGDDEDLYSDDLDQKEKLSRASLKARFEKVDQGGGTDKSASRWVVYANEKPILTATVDQITRGNAELLYDSVATKKFGSQLLKSIETNGFQVTAATLLKSAQVPPPAPMADPAAPPPPPVEEPVIEDDLVPPENVGGEPGNPEQIIQDMSDLIAEVDTKLSDLQEKVSGPVAEDAANLEGIAPAADDEFAAPVAEGPKTASQLMRMRKRVNGMLQEGISETITALSKHARELKTAKQIYQKGYSAMNGTQRDYLNDLTIAAVKDAKAMLSDTNKLMEAVVKYAYGTAEVEKRAAAEAAITKKALFDESGLEDELDIDQILAELEAESVEDSVEDMGDDVVLEETEEDLDELWDDEALDADDKPTVSDDGKSIVFPMETITSKASRAKARVKLAQQGLLGFNEAVTKAHPGGSVSADKCCGLDVKPTVDGAAFHTNKDRLDAMLQLANMPPKVRKQAAEIQKLVVEGKISAEDVDQLVSKGVDADAVKYFKQMWSAAKDKDSTEFANKLTQEHVQAKKAEEMLEYKARVKRAYEVANQMVAKGIIATAQVDSQVEDILKWNDAGFESIKNILAKQATVKQASVPMVGLLDSGQVILPVVGGIEKTAGNTDIRGLFDSYFENKKL